VQTRAESGRGERVLRAFGVTDRGRLRPKNEDRYSIDGDLHLCVVADGMGGHNAGEVASRIAVDAVIGHVRSAAPGAWPFGFDATLSEAGNRLRTAIRVANAQIRSAAATVPEYRGMGTTVVAGMEQGGILSVAHVGDSRLYLLSGGCLTQVTHDDSWIATVLARDPETDRGALAGHPLRNALTNVVGSGTITRVHVVERPLSAGERIVLTTDGVHGVLTAGEMAVLVAARDARAAAQDLVAAALEHGSRDNCTAVVADYVPS
jgi:serine/threonine protein phosphatase PrpC